MSDPIVDSESQNSVENEKSLDDVKAEVPVTNTEDSNISNNKTEDDSADSNSNSNAETPVSDENEADNEAAAEDNLNGSAVEVSANGDGSNAEPVVEENGSAKRKELDSGDDPDSTEITPKKVKVADVDEKGDVVEPEVPVEASA